MDQELERIADVVAARIRAQLGTDLPQPQGCTDPDSCSACGHCAQNRPGEVRSLVDTGAVRVSAAPGTNRVDDDIASIIDHTLLKPETSPDDLRKLCEEARKFNFASVCVNSSNVSRCRSYLGGSPVMICAVVGFPLGAMSSGAKSFEARDAVRDGAREVDMVVNIGALKAGDFNLVLEDISRVVAASRPAKVKVILETGMMDDEEKVAGCILSKLAGAHFVKTSTGFGKGGATAEDIALMRRVVGGAMGVKASGGIHNAQDARQMMAAGANRIGASASVSIVTGKTSTSAY